MLYVTTGQGHTDIDAYSGVLAYSSLLKKVGRDNIVYFSSPLNYSVTKTIQSWPVHYLTEIISNDEDQFIVVDVSDPKHIAKGVNHNNIIELFDHHYGFESFWTEKIGEKAKIEKVGACATQIWEEYKKQNVTIGSLDANLLAIAIISNTLNLESSITTNRDIQALEELQDFIDMPVDWKARYFKEQEVFIKNDIKEAVIHDTKVLNGNMVFGQLEIWDASELIQNRLTEIKEALTSFDIKDWMISIPSIREGINYIYTESNNLKSLLSGVIEIDFNEHIGKTKKLWLRKEILGKFNQLK